MIIGVPKEIKNNEFRVALPPAGADSLIKSGHEVLIEKDAGAGSGIQNEKYAACGARILDSAKETSSGTDGFRWWHTIIMSKCSDNVFTVNGLVGFVDDGRMFFSPAIFIMSGACPPPAPSV